MRVYVDSMLQVNERDIDKRMRVASVSIGLTICEMSMSGTIPVYVYTPNNLAKDAPIFIYYHGGGMVVGCRENVETTCQIISAYDSIFLSLSHSLKIYTKDRTSLR